MKSLHEMRRSRTGSVKIEHFEGQLNYEYGEGNWLSCTAGCNAKDTTDAITSSLYLMQLYPNEYIATKRFYKEDALDKSPEQILSAINGMKLDGATWR